ncbi:MAG: hypothetical protein ACREL5_06170 [Gemmatimonadales bacterium]
MSHDARFTLKPLTAAGIAAALDKADQYRLLNQPWAAESICSDVSAVVPGDRRALRTMLLAQTDQFAEDRGAVRRARDTLARLTEPYEQAYYAGVIAERIAKASLLHHTPGAHFAAWDELREAMAWYEKAEVLRPPGDDDAILRWNTCARLLNSSPEIVPRGAEAAEPDIGD